MKSLLKMSTKKISLMLVLFMITSVAVGIFLYMNNPKIKFIHLINKEYKSLVSILDKARESELAILSKDNTVTSTGNVSFDLSLANDMFGGSLNSLIAAVNGLDINYQYGSDPQKGNTYLKFNSNIDDKDFLNMELYQIGDKKYVYLNNIYDKYIESESTDLITTQGNQTDDVIYLTNKIKVSLITSLKTSDFTMGAEAIEINGQSIDTSKVTLKLTNERLREILKDVITDLKNDTKCIEILNRLSDGKIVKSSLDKTMTSLDSKQLLEKDMNINIYTKDNAIIKLDIIDGSSKIIEYLSYVAFNPIKEIIIFDDEQIALSSVFEEKSLNDISYKISLNNNIIIANGSIAKIIDTSTKSNNWNLKFIFDLALAYNNSLIGSLKISTQTTTKVGEDVNIIDINNVIKEENLTEEERLTISSKILEKIFNAIPVTVPMIGVTEEITY